MGPFSFLALKPKPMTCSLDARRELSSVDNTSRRLSVASRVAGVEFIVGCGLWQSELESSSFHRFMEST